MLFLLTLVTAPGTASRSTLQEQRSDQQQPLAVAGDVDPSFDPGIGVTTGGTINAVAIQGDGKMVLGGSFTSYNGVSSNGIVRIQSDGGLDTSFNFGTGFRGTLQNAVNALAIQSDGKILVGGEFTTYNGVSRTRLARINSDGSLDTSFNPGTILNNTVFALAIQSDGKILVGGSFLSLNRLARFNSDGTLDSPFHTTVNNTVFAVAVQTDGKILLGGSFTSFNGTGRFYFARVNSDGSLDNLFNPSSFVTPNGAVRSLVIQSDGKIVVGGLFKDFSFPSILARVNSDGSTDLSFNPLAFGNFVSALAIQGDGKILATGSFNLNFGGGITRNGVIRVNNDGSLDASFDPGAGHSSFNPRSFRSVATSSIDFIR